jgi:trehalose synthase-fused probable maltokinase
MPSEASLGPWIAAQRWFAGKAHAITALAIDDRIPLGDSVVLLVTVTLDDGSRQRYAVPLVADRDDALDHPGYTQALAALVADGGHVRGARGEIVGQPTRAFPRALGAAERGALGAAERGALGAAERGALDRPPSVRRLAGEQSNTSVVVGGQLILKHFRRLADGRSPDEEIGRFLTERAAFVSAPRLAGHVEYRRDGHVTTLAVVHELVGGAEDGWQWMLGALRGVYEAAAGQPQAPDPGGVSEIAGVTLDALARLGTVTAELHLALASDRDDPAFAPQPITAADVAAWTRAIERQLDEAHRVLGDRPRLDVPDAAGRLGGIGPALGGLIGRDRIRHHGDYHLGQTLLRAGRDRDAPERRADAPEWMIIDFEGEPLRSLEERRAKHAALRDVAGMLRSIDYAAVSAMPPGMDAWARAWERQAARAFTEAYRARARGAAFLPRTEAAFEQAVAAFVLEKAAYEVVYEASHRPAWLPIPLGGLSRALATLTGRPAGAA